MSDCTLCGSSIGSLSFFIDAPEEIVQRVVHEENERINWVELKRVLEEEYDITTTVSEVKRHYSEHSHYSNRSESIISRAFGLRDRGDQDGE